jgi:hypothetical protein
MKPGKLLRQSQKKVDNGDVIISLVVGAVLLAFVLSYIAGILSLKA